MSDTVTPKGAIPQRDENSFAIVPRTPMGMLTPEILENIVLAVRKNNIPIIKITSGHRLALVGIAPEAVEQVWTDLGLDIGHAVGLCLHYVQACPGTAVCKLGVQDSLALGAELEKLFVGNLDLPAKSKIGVSGCPNNCGEGL
ncbi:MAG: NAD(P)/FAD-dependent oxidoreductase, partial [Firmicutes bacterium]|nr:NAD(P)/FAD-dependent oxidoreductase [Bacillota bacterium]